MNDSLNRDDFADRRRDSAAVLDLPAPGALRTGKGWSVTMIALVFLAGGIAGAAATRATLAPRALSSLDEIPGRVADRMQRELRLSNAQRDRLEQIGRAHQAELQRIRAQIAPQLRAEFSRIIVEMATVLSPEQAEIWRPRAQRRIDVLIPSSDQAVPPTP